MSYFAKLCGEKDQSHLYLLLDSNTHNYLNYNNVYTVLYVLKSALVSLDCFCLVRTFIVTTKRPRYSSGALFCVTLA